MIKYIFYERCIVKKFLILGLLFANFSLSASLFENDQTDELVKLARFPLLVHYHEKANNDESIQSYIGTAMFGADWKKHLQVAQIAITQNDFKCCPPPAYGLVQVTICQKAQEEGREDILAFLQENAQYKEAKFQRWSWNR